MADFCGSVSTFVHRHLGERGFCPQCRRFRRKRALQMQFALVTPSVKMRLERSAERDKREIINNSSAIDVQSAAEHILNRPAIGGIKTFLFA